MLFRIFVTLLLLLLPTHLAAQPRSGDPVLTITVKDGSYAVSGVVGSEAEQGKLLDLIRKHLDIDLPAFSIRIDQFIRSFPPAWENLLLDDLAKVKRWKSGIYRWSIDPQKLERDLASYLTSLQIRQIDTPGWIKLIDPTKRVTVVNLSATWVGPSRAELPEIQKLFQAYRNSGLDVVLLTVDDDSHAMMKNFAKDLGLGFRVGFAPQELIQRSIRVTKFAGVPQNLVVVDGSLALITRGAGKVEIEKLKTFVEKHLAATQ